MGWGTSSEDGLGGYLARHKELWYWHGTSFTSNAPLTKMMVEPEKALDSMKVDEVWQNIYHKAGEGKAQTAAKRVLGGDIKAGTNWSSCIEFDSPKIWWCTPLSKFELW